MNELEFNEWTEKLTELRKSRRDFFSSEIREKKKGFTCSNFFQTVIRSLGEILDTWWTFEQNPAKKQAPENTQASLLHQEMESLIDFELRIIDSDLEFCLNQVPWESDEIAAEKKELVTFAEQLKSSYRIKIDSLLMSKKSEDPSRLIEITPPTYSRSMSGISAGTSGLAVGIMFIVGTILGGGASLYFQDAFKKEKASFQQEIEQLRSKNKELEESFNLYQQSYIQLAEGKSKTIPQLEASISEKMKRFKERKIQLNLDYAEQKAGVIRKTSGVQQTRSLDSVEKRRLEVMSELEERERNELEPLKKQLELLKQLSGTQ